MPRPRVSCVWREVCPSLRSTCAATPCPPGASSCSTASRRRPAATVARHRRHSTASTLALAALAALAARARTSLATASLATSVAAPVTSAPHSPRSSPPPAPPPHSPPAATRAVRRMTRHWCRTHTNSGRSGRLLASPASWFSCCQTLFLFSVGAVASRTRLSPHISPYRAISPHRSGGSRTRLRRGEGPRRPTQLADSCPVQYLTRGTGHTGPCPLSLSPRRATPMPCTAPSEAATQLGHTPSPHDAPRCRSGGERCRRGDAGCRWRTTGASMVSSSSRPPVSCLLSPTA